MKKPPRDLSALKLNITEQKNIAERLRLSEERYRFIFNNSPDFICINDVNGNFLDANPAVLKILGVSLEELKKKSYLDYFAGDNQEELIRLADELRQGHPIYGLNLKTRNSQGKIIEMEINAVPIFEDGRVVSVLSLARDIGERKRAENSLRQSEEIYKAILDTSIDGFWIDDLQGNIQEANDACSRMLGYSRSELLRMKISDIVVEEKPEETGARIRKIIATGGDRFETKLRHKDGKIIDFEISVNFMDISGGRLFVFSRDITERKRAEEILKENENKLVQAQDIAKLGNWDWDVEGNKLTWSETVYQMFGLGREIPLTFDGIVALIHPDDRNKNNSFINLLLEKEDHAEIQFRLLLPDGTIKHINQHAVAYRNQSSHPYRIVGTMQDITDLKQAEDKLRLSEEKYRNFFHNAQVGLYRTRITDGQVIECNERFAGMLGYKSREECLRDYSVARHFNDLDDQRRLLRKLKESGEITGYEARGVKADGSPIWVNYSVKMIPGTEHIEGAVVDITELKRLQEEKKVITERWSRFSCAATDLFYIFDQDLNLVDFNRALSPELAERFSRREAIGKKLTEVSPTIRDSDMLDKYLDVLKTGKPFHRSRQKISVSMGEFRYVCIDIFKVGDGLGMILHDVTEQIQAEEMIKNASTAWRITFDSIPDMIMVQDLNYRILRANQALADFLGLSFPEIIGQQCFRLIHKTDAPPEYCRQSRCISEGKSCNYMVRSERLQRDYLITTTPMFNAANKCYGVIHVTRDITEEKKLQKRLKESERMAAIGEIAGNIAHEIKNPLFAISSGIEILHDHLKLGGAQKETLEIILRETIRMDYLVRQLLDYGRHRALNEIAFAPVDMREVVDEVASLNSGLMKVNGIKVEKKMPPDLPPVMVEKGEMIQVFINLLQNAIEVSGKGDVIEIEARADEKRKTLIVSMKDMGPGIPKEMKDKIFEIFFTTKKGSYGMGLAISRRIILDHGGDIRVESEPGKGAKFIVELPIK
ncbi:MAG: PAS domain S-box protein [bacterium]|nr:PAS domain S-box protein [bacterium]